jgi:poly-beta-1,6-N-acetyl-D-glucosamine synthase
MKSEGGSLLEVLFWLGFLLIFYSYFGYGIVLYLMVRIKRLFNPVKLFKTDEFEPEVCFVVPSYNEAGIIKEKIKNCLALDYPEDKLKFIFITDGSTDGTEEIISNLFPQVTVLHELKRCGKSAAENRAMKFAVSPIIVLSDANTILPSHALKKMVRHFADPSVGAVSGEKRIIEQNKDNATGSGEGIYWKYESFLKKLDSEMLTLVGAAGELFSFRRELYTDLEEDTILDDFVLSMRIAEKKFKVVYEPEAYALETASESVKEEMKRKIRICAGGWQAMIRLRSLLNPMQNFLLTFQYISHRVLRWSITPLVMFLFFPINLILIKEGLLYQLMFYCQCFFYILSMLGWYFENQKLKSKVLFIPFYFFMMTYAVFAGFFRYV